ncbi:hypothetical protein V8F06_006585 [Rhypophila decipiens]
MPRGSSHQYALSDDEPERVPVSEPSAVLDEEDEVELPCFYCGRNHGDDSCKEAEGKVYPGEEGYQSSGSRPSGTGRTSATSNQDEQMTDAEYEEEEGEGDGQDVDMTDASDDEYVEEGEEEYEEGDATPIGPAGHEEEDEEYYEEEEDQEQVSDVDMGTPRPTESTPYTGSTSQHGHESWSTFKYKVLKQARVHFEVDGCLTTSHLSGGSYNRVASIELNGVPKWIIRLSRKEGKDLLADLAPLFFLENHTTIPAPRVVAWDTEGEGTCVERPFMIMKRLNGDCLNRGNYGTKFDPEYKDQVARELGLAYREMLATKSSRAGVMVFPPGVELEASCNNPSKDYPVWVAPFCPHRGLRRYLRYEARPWDPHSPPEQPPVQVLKSLFDAMSRSATAKHAKIERDYGYDKDEVRDDKAKRRKELKDEIDLWTFFSGAMGQMEQLGVFPADMPNALYHSDMAKRNLIYDRKQYPNGRGLGILDWDDCYFLPIFVACRPPAELWSNEISQDYYIECLDPEPELTDEEQARKDIFFEAAGPEYAKYANDEVYQVARDMLRCCILGLNQRSRQEKAFRVTEQWKKQWAGYCADPGPEGEYEE